MMCEDVQTSLSAYYDEELTTEENRSVLLHLHDCAECATLAKNFHALSQLAQEAFDSLTAPDDFESRVLFRIENSIRSHQTFRIQLATIWNTVLLLAMTSVVILSPVGTFLWSIALVCSRLVRHLYMLLIMSVFGQGWLLTGVVATVGCLLAVGSIRAMGRLMRKVAL